MKKSFNSTAAAELFTAPSAQPEPTKKRTGAASPAATPTKENQPYALTWKAAPDGEARTRRIQVVMKPSVAAKAGQMAKEAGISVNYLFETLVLQAWNDREEK